MDALLTDKILRAIAHAQGFESQYVDIDGCRLHYLEKQHGVDRPTVVLVHGISAAGVHYGKIMPQLYDMGYNVIVPDLPAHGFSASPGQSPLTANRAYEMLAAFLDRVIDRDERFLLVGNSMGGAFSLRYALRRPERLHAIVAISPAGGFASREDWESFRSGLLMESRADALSFMDRLYARLPWYAPLVSGVLLKGFLRQGIRDLLLTTTYEDFDETRDIPKLAAPLLLIWGQKDRVFPARNLDWFRANLPARAVVENPAEVGHCPQLDSAGWLLERLEGYFAETLSSTARLS